MGFLKFYLTKSLHILEAPSLPPPKKSKPRLPEFQVFHLKTSERAMQHSSAASSSFLPSDKSDKLLSLDTLLVFGVLRPSTVDVPKQEGSEITHKFKARPLNKKIFSSKGDIGVFRNSKREPTIPMEFNFPTDKRFQYNPPVDLFNKLSLTTELRQNTVSQPRLPRPTFIATKGSKENTVDSLRQGNRTIHTVKDRAQMFGVKQTQCGGDVETDVGTRANMSRYS
ncbi:TPX2 central domain [Macleaya cordata]|uniref:TPX2 central domain n=1 Tax=Macleaya cordata TaxID=56857 RepID=A0A200QB91_MACCD|nr:TPX2 central domain [Macleaya cordata]